MGKINDKGAVIPEGNDKVAGSDQSSDPAGETVNFTIDSIDDYFSGKRTAVPALPDSDGVKGSYAVEPGFLYLCVDTDVWQRTAIATWY